MFTGGLAEVNVTTEKRFGLDDRPEKTDGNITDVKCDRMSCNNWCIRQVTFIVLKRILGKLNVGMWV